MVYAILALAFAGAVLGAYLMGLDGGRKGR